MSGNFLELLSTLVISAYCLVQANCTRVDVGMGGCSMAMPSSHFLAALEPGISGYDKCFKLTKIKFAVKEELFSWLFNFALLLCSHKGARLLTDSRAGCP